MTDAEIIKQVKLNGGGVVRLAAFLQCTPQAISMWKRVPVMRVIDVEKATGIPRHVLRPDIYPLED